MHKKLNGMGLITTNFLLNTCNSVDVIAAQQNMFNLQEQAQLAYIESHRALDSVAFGTDSSQYILTKKRIYTQQIFDANFDIAGRPISLLCRNQ